MVHPIQIPPTFGHPPDSSHPSALSNIALHHRSPAPEFHDARRRSIFVRELCLFVISAPITTLVHGRPKKPRRSQSIVQRNHRSSPGGHVQQIQQNFHKIVRLHRASRNANDGNVRARLPIPTEVIRQSHTAGRVSLHGVDAAVGSACSSRDHRPGLWRQAIDPVTRQDRLSGFLVGPKRRPISFALILFVGDRSFDHQDERRQACLRLPGGNAS